MPEMLDIRVAQAMMRLRLVERALHSHGSWTMRYAGVEVPASRFIRADRVSFVAHFPPMCTLAEPVLSIDLLCDGEMLRCISLDDALAEDGSRVWWDLALDEPVPAR